MSQDKKDVHYVLFFLKLRTFIVHVVVHALELNQEIENFHGNEFLINNVKHSLNIGKLIMSNAEATTPNEKSY